MKTLEIIGSVLGVLFLAVVITNLKGLIRYIRISNM